jgi:hypothetical protein
MHATNGDHMPQLAGFVTDPFGTSIVDQWIKSVATCP